MTNVSLQDITSENRDACLNLSLPDLHEFAVLDVQSSIELASKYDDVRPLAILDLNDQVVGFAMYGIDQETGNWKIFRLMIDAAFRRRGYGKAAMREMIDVLRSDHGADSILIRYHTNYDLARRIYRDLGFEEIGQDGPIVLARLG